MWNTRGFARKTGKSGVSSAGAFVPQKSLRGVTHWRDLCFSAREATEATKGCFQTYIVYSLTPLTHPLHPLHSLTQLSLLYRRIMPSYAFLPSIFMVSLRFFAKALSEGIFGAFGVIFPPIRGAGLSPASLNGPRLIERRMHPRTARPTGPRLPPSRSRSSRRN